MPKCPKCKKEIDYLKYYEPREAYYHFRVRQSLADYEMIELLDLDEVGDFECPECSEVLFNDEAEAEKFLREVENDNEVREKTA
jgi:hypothetical protein